MTRDYTNSRMNWNGIEIEIRWNPDYIVYDDQTHMAHLEVESIAPARAPLPITETGYRSHFTPIANIQGYATPEDFVEAWLHEASYSEEWQERRQLSLF